MPDASQIRTCPSLPKTNLLFPAPTHSIITNLNVENIFNQVKSTATQARNALGGGGGGNKGGMGQKATDTVNGLRHNDKLPGNVKEGINKVTEAGKGGGK